MEKYIIIVAIILLSISVGLNIFLVTKEKEKKVYSKKRIIVSIISLIILLSVIIMPLIFTVNRGTILILCGVGICLDILVLKIE